MRVKRYVAADIQEAMMKIKNELGEEAVILHTRYFKEGGVLGFFKKNYVEVTAATDTDMKIKQDIKQNLEFDNHSINSIRNLQKEIEKHNQINIPKDIDQIEIQEKDPIADYPRLGKDLFYSLKKQEVEEKLAKKIVKETLMQLSFQKGMGHEHHKSIFVHNLIKQIKKCKSLDICKGTHKKPLVCALVGPTGVGKTTTLAKLATKYAILEQKKVAFLTIDTYRIAAVEQLKTIGDIMNVPVNTVYSLSQIPQCLMSMSDNDIVFIDTAGRSHKNSHQMDELKMYLDLAKVDDIILVLSGTSKYCDLMDVLKAYKDFNIKKIIFTKLDETSYFGSIYNIACQSKYSIAYFTTGQNIPDDIVAADAVNLVELMMKEQEL